MANDLPELEAADLRYREALALVKDAKNAANDAKAEAEDAVAKEELESRFLTQLEKNLGAANYEKAKSKLEKAQRAAEEAKHLLNQSSEKLENQPASLQLKLIKALAHLKIAKKEEEGAYMSAINTNIKATRQDLDRSDRIIQSAKEKSELI
uniref:Uncharacterized protein n=1 Tax=Ditylenchus dipsaci TaxID=166011 RepID=A0A915DND3_9BILA